MKLYDYIGWTPPVDNLADAETIKIPVPLYNEGEETILLPVIKQHRSGFFAIAKLIILTILFFIIITSILWEFDYFGVIGLVGMLLLAIALYSTSCASVVRRYLSIQGKSKETLTISTQFHLLKEDTLTYLRAIKVSSK